MSITIRPARVEDAKGMWELIHELAIFEKSGDEHTVEAKKLGEDLEANHYSAFVAEEHGNLIGMALFYPIYSTWKGLSFYLEDIIVKESQRRQGIGRMLFDAVVYYTDQKKGGRLGWQVLEWNVPAIEFYKKYKATLDPEWITCRLSREQIEELTA